MTPARSLLIAMATVVFLFGARAIAGDEQFPRGLLGAVSRKGKSCTIETRPLSFGEYNPLSGMGVDAVGQVIYTCGNGGLGVDATGVKNIRIQMSRGWTNSYSDRGMAGPSFGTLYYNIYLDATHRTIWGDGTNGTDFYFDAKPPNNTPVIVRAYGMIRPLQDVPAGPVRR